MTDSAACKATPRAFERGFSLVELMVAVVVGMLGILAIMSVFVSSEAQKRTTTGSADASENALMALVAMERDLRMAGLGMVGLGCTTVNGYNSALPAPNVQFAALPVSITSATVSDKVGNVISDTIAVAYSASSFGNIPTTLVGPLPTSNAPLLLANGDGIVKGDVLLISQPSLPCALVQASAPSVNNGANWTVDHDATVPFNQAGNTFASISGLSAGFSVGARVTNMGAMVYRQYFVQNGSLVMQDMKLPVSAPTNPVTLVENVIAMRAQYGVDTGNDGYLDVYQATPPADAAQLVALQIAVVARGGQLEKTAVTPGPLVLWPGGTVANGGAVALTGEQQQYRYKVYKTIVPLRNVIWGNNP